MLDILNMSSPAARVADFPRSLREIPLRGAPTRRLCLRLRPWQGLAIANQSLDLGMRRLCQADLGHRRHHPASLPLPLTTWFRAAYLMATHSNGISALQLQRQLGLGSYKSAW